MITVQNLHKHLKRFNLNDISFKVHEGEIFALCGIQGSGKTVLAKVLQKQCFKSSGTFDVENEKIGMVIPDQRLYGDWTVYQCVRRYAHMNNRFPTRAEIMNTLNVVGLRRRARMRVRELVPNRYARLKIAIAVVCKPKVLILDSPFDYLSEIEARQIRIILKTLADKFGCAIFLTAVSFYGIEEIFDTMSIIGNGSIICTHSYNDLSRFNDKYAKTCITSPMADLVCKLVGEEMNLKSRMYGENDVVINAHPDRAQEIYDFLLSKNIKVDNVTRVHKSIENLFNELREGGAVS